MFQNFLAPYSQGGSLERFNPTPHFPSHNILFMVGATKFKPVKVKGKKNG